MVYQINPLQDRRWVEFICRHPMASVFHTPGWLKALDRSYGYKPTVFTTARPGQQLSDGLVVCQIKSWLTGSRMVSLPFSDHCDPLVNSSSELRLLLDSLCSVVERQQWKYLELRPLMPNSPSEFDPQLCKSADFRIQVMDLRPDVGVLFHSFHKSCIQRKIQRAEREGLTYEQGRSESLLAKFYYLLLLTRRRHKLPPQPRSWFRNLVDCMDDRLSIRIASKDGLPIASILTLSFKDSLVYKYGCSDARFHNVGGMHLLFWKAITEEKQLGARRFDFGRSEPHDSGLVAFKERWGGISSTLTYYRYPSLAARFASVNWGMSIAKSACARLPDFFLSAVGNLLYRHVG